MTLARAVALGGLATLVVVVSVVLMGGEQRHRYELRFATAGQLVKDDDVQIGGRRVGAITDIRLTSDNEAVVDIEVEDGYAPLHRGTTATIRATSLSGIANRYIALSPGPNNAPELEEGATLPSDRTTTIVDLDQLFNTLDPEARRDLQRVVQGSATQLEGRGAAANRVAQYFNPALSTTRRLAEELTYDGRALERFLVEGARTMEALAARREDLTGLVSNANATSRAIADEGEALGETLRRAPRTLRRANSTFVDLRATLGDLDALVAESKPATRRLAPLLRELRPLLRDAEPTIGDLRRLVTRPGDGNDMIDLLRKQPRLTAVAAPAFRSSSEALRQSLPVLDFARPYFPDLVGWFRDFGQASANYDANGHYARIQPIFNAFSLASTPGGDKLSAIPPSKRMDGYQYGLNRRCPGAAVQPAPDGSAPFLDDGELDCDPQAVLPGP